VSTPKPEPKFRWNGNGGMFNYPDQWITPSTIMSFKIVDKVRDGSERIVDISDINKPQLEPADRYLISQIGDDRDVRYIQDQIGNIDVQGYISRIKFGDNTSIVEVEWPVFQYLARGVSAVYVSLLLRHATTVSPRAMPDSMDHDEATNSLERLFRSGAMFR
jgi:hypothetical protein